jgi:hypothetical protein
MKKFELTEEAIEIAGTKLYRIKALRTVGKVKKGTLGVLSKKRVI